MDTQRNTDELLREPEIIESVLGTLAVVLTLIACALIIIPAITG